MFDIQEMLKNLQAQGGLGGAMDGTAGAATMPGPAPGAMPPPPMMPPGAATGGMPGPQAPGAEERIGRGMMGMPPPQPASPFNFQQFGKDFGKNLGKGIESQYGMSAKPQQQQKPMAPMGAPPQNNAANMGGAIQSLRGSAPGAPGQGGVQSPFQADGMQQQDPRMRRGIWG